MALVELVAALVASAGLAAALLRVGLIARPVKPDTPDPAKYGHPMAGPASVSAAHAAMSRRGTMPRPKFKT
jgi:hypothetical protein